MKKHIFIFVLTGCIQMINSGAGNDYQDNRHNEHVHNEASYTNNDDNACQDNDPFSMSDDVEFENAWANFLKDIENNPVLDNESENNNFNQEPATLSTDDEADNALFDTLQKPNSSTPSFFEEVSSKNDTSYDYQDNRHNEHVHNEASYTNNDDNACQDNDPFSMSDDVEFDNAWANCLKDIENNPVLDNKSENNNFNQEPAILPTYSELEKCFSGSKEGYEKTENDIASHGDLESNNTTKGTPQNNDYQDNSIKKISDKILESTHTKASLSDASQAQQRLADEIIKEGTIPTRWMIKQCIQRGASLNVNPEETKQFPQNTLFVRLIDIALHSIPQTESQRNCEKLAIYQCLMSGAFLPSHLPNYEHWANKLFQALIKRANYKHNEIRLFWRAICYPHELTQHDYIALENLKGAKNIVNAKNIVLENWKHRLAHDQALAEPYNKLHRITQQTEPQHNQSAHKNPTYAELTTTLQALPSFEKQNRDAHKTDQSCTPNDPPKRNKYNPIKAQKKLFSFLDKNRDIALTTIDNRIDEGASLNEAHPDEPHNDTFFMQLLDLLDHTLPHTIVRKKHQCKVVKYCLKLGGYIPHHPSSNAYKKKEQQLQRVLDARNSQRSRHAHNRNTILVNAVCYPENFSIKELFGLSEYHKNSLLKIINGNYHKRGIDLIEDDSTSQPNQNTDKRPKPEHNDSEQTPASSSQPNTSNAPATKRRKINNEGTNHAMQWAAASVCNASEVNQGQHAQSSEKGKTICNNNGPSNTPPHNQNATPNPALHACFNADTVNVDLVLDDAHGNVSANHVSDNKRNKAQQAALMEAQKVYSKRLGEIISGNNEGERNKTNQTALMEAHEDYRKRLVDIINENNEDKRNKINQTALTEAFAEINNEEGLCSLHIDNETQ